MNRCITVLQTAPLPLGYAAVEDLAIYLKKRTKSSCNVGIDILAVLTVHRLLLFFSLEQA